MISYLVYHNCVKDNANWVIVGQGQYKDTIQVLAMHGVGAKCITSNTIFLRKMAICAIVSIINVDAENLYDTKELNLNGINVSSLC